jgi:hypothetical protein
MIKQQQLLENRQDISSSAAIMRLELRTVCSECRTKYVEGIQVGYTRQRSRQGKDADAIQIQVLDKAESTHVHACRKVENRC